MEFALTAIKQLLDVLSSDFPKVDEKDIRIEFYDSTSMIADVLIDGDICMTYQYIESQDKWEEC